jgi:hypothetical protein
MSKTNKKRKSGQTKAKGMISAACGTNPNPAAGKVKKSGKIIPKKIIFTVCPHLFLFTAPTIDMDITHNKNKDVRVNNKEGLFQ